MLTDTHCHLNIMVKKSFDVALTQEEIEAAHEIIKDAYENGVTKIINVGTSLIESENSLALATRYENVFAAIGIHPNDITKNWREEFNKLSSYAQHHKKHKIIGIGECGIDLHYPGSDLNLQKEVFRAHIELALEHDLALIVHSRDAAAETLEVLYEYKTTGLRGTIHCFSYGSAFAQKAIGLGFVLGIDGPITYPKNNELRNVVAEISLDDFILETDAPFLPPQIMRGKQNHPRYIKLIAEYIAELRETNLETISVSTEKNVRRIFRI